MPLAPLAGHAASSRAQARAQHLPAVIQGGMGVAVSDWRLARAVSLQGQLGVVSGTALDAVLARRLQDGDPGGHLRRALEHFPVREMAQGVLRRFYRAQGRSAGQPYTPVPKQSIRPRARPLELAIVANFAEVWLAKEGHDGLVGINFLEKIQLATPSAAYGAMLAGVDYVLMGAGIPAEIPNLLDRLARHEACAISLHVEGATQPYEVSLDPEAITGGGLAPLRRPQFLAVISAHVLATRLAREEATRPDGFVVESPRAGGHNAPPRGRLVLDEDGQPVFGPRDDADLARIADVGLPFWLAGGYGTPDGLRAAQAAGAAGVQVGSIFALADESGLEPSLRRSVIDRLRDGTLEVRTDPLASPTGFPFKVVQLPGTLSDPAEYAARPRLCDVGHLRVPFEREPGTVDYRCPGAPVAGYVGKGGAEADTVGRQCLCNALLADVGLGQTRRSGYTEPPLVTLGADVDGAQDLVGVHPDGWSAAVAIGYLLG